MNDEKGIVIERIFDAPRELVWKAWTDEEMIKKWWGPEGFTAPSVKVNFSVGEKYIFAMRGPAGSEWDKDMYSAGVYTEIVPNERIVATDYFSDAEGNMMEPSEQGQDSGFPKQQTITVLFEDTADGKTKLTVKYPKPETEEQMEAMLKSGMKEGWQSSLNKLENALKEA